MTDDIFLAQILGPLTSLHSLSQSFRKHIGSQTNRRRKREKRLLAVLRLPVVVADKAVETSGFKALKTRLYFHAKSPETPET
jgi:hypothetical protein